MVTLAAIIAVYLIGCAVAFMRLVWLSGGASDAALMAFVMGGVFDWPLVVLRRLMGRKFGGS